MLTSSRSMRQLRAAACRRMGGLDIPETLIDPTHKRAREVFAQVLALPEAQRAAETARRPRFPACRSSRVTKGAGFRAPAKNTSPGRTRMMFSDQQLLPIWMAMLRNEAAASRPAWALTRPMTPAVSVSTVPTRRGSPSSTPCRRERAGVRAVRRNAMATRRGRHQRAVRSRSGRSGAKWLRSRRSTPKTIEMPEIHRLLRRSFARRRRSARRCRAR